MVKGTQYCGISDIDGNFEIRIVGPEAVLVFSYIGFNTQEVRVQKSSLISVVMKEELSMLDEVVVVGYGVQRKSVLTGAISTVSADDMAHTAGDTPPEDPEDEEADDEDTEREAEERLYGELLQLHVLRNHFSDAGFCEDQLGTGHTLITHIM